MPWTRFYPDEERQLLNPADVIFCVRDAKYRGEVTPIYQFPELRASSSEAMFYLLAYN